MQKPWHTAKVPIFAVCKNHGTRQRFELCRVPRLQGTRQIFGHVIIPGWLLYFAVGREWHTANPLPCARYIAHGRVRLCRCLVAVWALPCAAHDKCFAVCISATAKQRFPVVQVALAAWERRRWQSLARAGAVTAAQPGAGRSIDGDAS